MKNIEAYAGSAVWVAVSVLMAAAALEPVAVQARHLPPVQEFATGLCPDGSTELAMGCESIHL